MVILQPDFKLHLVILYSVSHYINAYSKELYFVLYISQSYDFICSFICFLSLMENGAKLRFLKIHFANALYR